MFKRGVLCTILITGIYASENPFAIEQSLEKIEQEEDDLLNSLTKEQKILQEQKTAKTNQVITPKIQKTTMTPAIEKKPKQPQELKESKKSVENKKMKRNKS